MAARTSRSSAPVGATRPGGTRGLARAGVAPGVGNAPEHRAGDVAGGGDAGGAGRTRQRAPDPRGRPRRLVLALARCAGPEPRSYAPLAAADARVQSRRGRRAGARNRWDDRRLHAHRQRHAPAAAGVGPGAAVQDRRRGRHRRHGPPRPLGTVLVPAVRAIEGRRAGVRGPHRVRLGRHAVERPAAGRGRDWQARARTICQRIVFLHARRRRVQRPPVRGG